MEALRNGERKALEAELTEGDRKMLDFSVKLAREPRSMTRGDTETLRSAGFSDAAILEIVHVVGFFSYYNRLADGLGIDPEPETAGLLRP